MAGIVLFTRYRHWFAKFSCFTACLYIWKKIGGNCAHFILVRESYRLFRRRTLKKKIPSKERKKSSFSIFFRSHRHEILSFYKLSHSPHPVRGFPVQTFFFSMFSVLSPTFTYIRAYVFVKVCSIFSEKEPKTLISYTHSIRAKGSVVTRLRLYKFYIIFMEHKVVTKTLAFASSWGIENKGRDRGRWIERRKKEEEILKWQYSEVYIWQLYVKVKKNE